MYQPLSLEPTISLPVKAKLLVAAIVLPARIVAGVAGTVRRNDRRPSIQALPVA